MTDFDDALKALQGPDEILDTAREAEFHPLKANTAILGAYYNLSIALGWYLHNDEAPINATFPTFAAWSAQSLRADVAEDDEGGYLSGEPDASGLWLGRRLYDVVTNAVLTDRGAIARNIACGQAAIYEEVGLAMWTLLDTTLRALKKDKAKIDWDEEWRKYTAALVSYGRTIDRSRLSRRTPSRLPDEDVEVLQRAVEPYYQVLKHSATITPKQRSELILLGNVRLVAYEQRRLQPVLERNLKLLPHALRLRVVTEWFGRNDLRTRAATRAYQIASPLFPRVEEAFQIAATRHVYRMILGQERLRFGVDVPLPPPAHQLLRVDQPTADQERYSVGDFFPYDLQTLEHPPLWAEWQQHDRSFGQGERTAVDNWLRLPERLNFIVNVFRSRQQLCALYERPSATPAPPLPEPPVLGPVRVQHLRPDDLEQLRSFAADAAPPAGSAT